MSSCASSPLHSYNAFSAQCMKYKHPNCSTTDSHHGVLIQSQYHILVPSPGPIIIRNYVAYAQSKFLYFGTAITCIAMLFGLLSVEVLEKMPTVGWIRGKIVIILNATMYALFKTNIHYMYVHRYVSKSCVKQCLNVLMFMLMKRLPFTNLLVNKFESSCITLVRLHVKKNQ